MPYARQTLSQLKTQIAQDIQAQLPGTDPLLRFSNLQILGAALAGLTNLTYGYVDWISLQAVPFTAEDEFLAGWGALKGVIRTPATQAVGTVSFPGTDGTVLPSGTQLVRGDGKTFTTTSSGTVAGSTVTVAARADADPAGLVGAFGNTDPGALMQLGTAIAGISSTGTVASAFTGGADLESDDALRNRILLAFQTTSHGGDAQDYIEWALAVPGVTRAWVVPNGFGGGTVLVYTMFDVAEAAHGGFPQGANGVATSETRDAPATGDQLAVANAIYSQQPVTALVYALAPGQDIVPFTITGTTGWSTGTKSDVQAAIDAVFLATGQIDAAGGATTILLSDLNSAIGAVTGTAGYAITVPSANITVPAGQLPVRGTMTWAA